MGRAPGAGLAAAAYRPAVRARRRMIPPAGRRFAFQAETLAGSELD
jgi:hypothetical protein